MNKIYTDISEISVSSTFSYDYVIIVGIVYTYRLSLFRKRPKKKILYKVKRKYSPYNSNGVDERLTVNNEVEEVLNFLENNPQREISLGKKIKIVLTQKVNELSIIK